MLVDKLSPFGVLPQGHMLEGAISLLKNRFGQA
jgi:hypothetical protein